MLRGFDYLVPTKHIVLRQGKKKSPRDFKKCRTCLSTSFIFCILDRLDVKKICYQIFPSDVTSRVMQLYI